MEITCDGIVIRETAYGESDKIITFLTAEYGKITVMAKGVRSIKSKNSPAVQLFCLSSFELLEKNGRYTLKTATVVDSFYAVRDDIERLALASYFSDVVGTVCTENNDETEMLRLLKNVLYAMSRYPEIPLWRIKAAFEMKCMAANGLTPELSCCAECGKPASECADKNGMLIFSPDDGSPLCPDCMRDRETAKSVPISPLAVAALEYILASPQSRMLKFPVDNPSAEKEIGQLCEKYLVCQTGRRYDTLSFYKTVCAM